MARKARDVLSVEWVTLELVRTAYSTRGGLFARMDPRIVLLWYVLVGGAPWFTHNITILAALFVSGAVWVTLARVGPLVLGLFVFSLLLEVVNVFLVAIVFGGDVGTLLALLELTLKLGAVSLASMAAFVSLDPEKLSTALLALRFPPLVSFAVSYGFRMLPILVDEFRTVMEGYHVRSAPLASRGLLGWRAVVRWARLAVLSFYPIFLNVATRVRTTVEALETRGLNHSFTHPEGRRLRVAHLRTSAIDGWVMAATVAALAGAWMLGDAFALYRT